MTKKVGNAPLGIKKQYPLSTMFALLPVDLLFLFNDFFILCCYWRTLPNAALAAATFAARCTAMLLMPLLLLLSLPSSSVDYCL